VYAGWFMAFIVWFVDGWVGVLGMLAILLGADGMFYWVDQIFIRLVGIMGRCFILICDHVRNSIKMLDYYRKLDKINSKAFS